MFNSKEKMERRLEHIQVGDSDELVYVSKGIFDYFDQNNFPRLLAEYEFAKSRGARFFVGLYSTEIMERAKHIRPLKDKVTDQDRINLVESLDFVDGAFLIDSLDPRKVLQAIQDKILAQQSIGEVKPLATPKKYKVGYASGAFSNFHKGHAEHLKMMSEQCDTVIVAANSDRLIQEYKNKTATVPEELRREIIDHIKYVDKAIIVDEYDKVEAVKKIRENEGLSVDAIFVGSDWMGDPKWRSFESRLAELGVVVEFTDRPKDGISTTVIDKNKGSHKEFRPESR